MHHNARGGVPEEPKQGGLSGESEAACIYTGTPPKNGQNERKRLYLHNNGTDKTDERGKTGVSARGKRREMPRYLPCPRLCWMRSVFGTERACKGVLCGGRQSY